MQNPLVSILFRSCVHVASLVINPAHVDTDCSMQPAGCCSTLRSVFLQKYQQWLQRLELCPACFSSKPCSLIPQIEYSNSRYTIPCSLATTCHTEANPKHHAPSNGFPYQKVPNTTMPFRHLAEKPRAQTFRHWSPMTQSKRPPYVIPASHVPSSDLNLP